MTKFSALAPQHIYYNFLSCSNSKRKLLFGLFFSRGGGCMWCVLNRTCTIYKLLLSRVKRGNEQSSTISRNNSGFFVFRQFKFFLTSGSWTMHFIKFFPRLFAYFALKDFGSCRAESFPQREQLHRPCVCVFFVNSTLIELVKDS